MSTDKIVQDTNCDLNNMSNTGFSTSPLLIFLWICSTKSRSQIIDGVPECFEDIYDPINDDYIDDYDDDDGWTSVDSVENTYKRSDKKTGDGGVKETGNLSECAEDEKNHSPVNKNDSLTSIETVVSSTDKQKWVDSWCLEDRKLNDECVANGETMVISIDGYFRKNRKAGYGVIIRNRYTGVPFLASAAVYKQGKPISSLYHELQGLNKGLELAIKYALCDIFLVYRSRVIIPAIVGASGFHWCSCDGRDNDPVLCKGCAQVYFSDCTEEDFQLRIYPLIQEIKDNFALLEGASVWGYGYVKRKYNKAADYLAKLRLNKEEMKPHEFSEELKDILYEDSLGGDLMEDIRKSGYGTDEERIFNPDGIDEECIFNPDETEGYGMNEEGIFNPDETGGYGMNEEGIFNPDETGGYGMNEEGIFGEYSN